MPASELDKLETLPEYYEIMKARAAGDSPNDIAKRMYPELPLASARRQIFRAVKSCVEQFYDGIQDTIRERFLSAAIRVERLWRIIELQLQQMETTNTFYEPVFRQALAVMDREAKLYGFDMQIKDRTGGSLYKWIDEAPIDDILQECEKYGIPIPQKSF